MHAADGCDGADPSTPLLVDETWNPTTGCSRVSEGCRYCYIERTPPFRMHGRKLGDPVQLHPERLNQPLRWTKPRRVFVNSLSDLFHEDVPLDFIVSVYASMIAASWHTFQILTKRPERRRKLLTARRVRLLVAERAAKLINALRGQRSLEATENVAAWYGGCARNIHEGISVEDQPTADERIPILLQTPAAVRFVSAEPLLGAVKFVTYFYVSDARFDGRTYQDDASFPERGLHWVVVGGESGPGARPCDLAWIRSIVQQCRAAGVPCFVKQVGSQPRGICQWKYHQQEPPQWLDDNGTLLSVSGAKTGDLCHARDDYFWPCTPKLNDRKGGDPSEWPVDVRVREFPR